MTPPEATSPRVLVHTDKASLAEAIGARLILAIQDAQRREGWADIALTGGSMGSALVQAVTDSPLRSEIDPSRLGIWWGDERYLPAGDPDRNDTQNDEAGLSTWGVPADQVHRVPGPDSSESVEDSAQAYARTLGSVRTGSFAVTVLGVGPDGHVASLFPGHPAQLTAGSAAVAVHDSPKPPPDRVSLTLETLRASEQVWFVVAGADKAEAVSLGVSGADPSQSSAALVTGRDETVWLVDRAAAGQAEG